MFVGLREKKKQMEDETEGLGSDVKKNKGKYMDGEWNLIKEKYTCS